MARQGEHSRRSTRLSLQIPVLLACLDPAHGFREECKTAVVNAHGCGVIVHVRLKNETPVMVKLIANGAIAKGRVVLAIQLLENASWLLGVEFDTPGNFWGVENPPSDWRLQESECPPFPQPLNSGKKKPHFAQKPDVAPTFVRYETKDQTPIELRIAAQALSDEVIPQFDSGVAADYTTVVDGDRKYIEVSDSFCQLVGYRREELIGKRYDELTAPGTNDIPTVFRLFVKHGYMHGLWMLVHRTGTRVLVRYEAWVRPDCCIQSKMELVSADC